MIWMDLFVSFLKVGLFSVGGGYAAMPLIQSEVVSGHGWLTLREFTDLITIAEMTPGPIAINSATFVGMHIAGLPGVLIATLGCIFPSLIIVSLLAFIYNRYKNMSALKSILASLRPAVVALIACAGLSILRMVAFGDRTINPENADWIGLCLFAAAFIALRRLKLSPIVVMTLCGVAGLAANLLLPSV